MTTSKKIIFWLEEKGKTTKWLADQLWLCENHLKIRLKDNIWMAGDIIRLQELGCIKD